MKRNIGPVRFLAIALLSSSTCLLSAQLQAQEVQEDDSTVIFPATYFTQWAPVTAQDMINRIPGVGTATGGNFGTTSTDRGLGGGGGNQILIDGKRVAGKSNEANSQLQRISASKVERIELIRGTSAALDVRGDLIVNIVLTEALSSRTYAYELNADYYSDDYLQPGGKFSVNGQQGAFNYLLSAEAEPRHDYRPSRESSVLGDYSPNDRIREERIRKQTTYTYAANLSYDFSSASSARLNMLYSDFDNRVDVDRSITDLRVSPEATRQERETTPGDNGNWEVGADYEWRLPNNHRFKILGIASERDEATVRERFQVGQGGTEQKDLYVNSDTSLAERIVRSSYSFGVASGQDLEVGVERAETTLDSELRLGAAGPGPGSELHGGLVPVDVRNADSRVQEIRYEPFVVHNWQMSPRMALESSMIYEMSEITQTGDVYNQRDFNFLKPKLDWRFDVRPGLQVRATAAKTVKQLSFSDFVASSDTRDDDSATMAGNANLKQEQELHLSLGGEYRLPADVGVVDGNVYFKRRYDVIERIDVTADPSRPESANGNIGDGDEWGIELSGSVRMAALNMPELMIISSLQVRESEIVDPFLGTKRRLQNHDRGRFQLGFRHDIPRFRMTYGLNWNNRFDGNIKRYDVDNIESTYGDPNVTAFLEFITPNNVRIRFDARNATNNDQCRIRTRYDGKITSGVIREIEDYCYQAARVVSIKINGTF